MSWGDDAGVARLPGGPSVPDPPATSRDVDAVVIDMHARFDDLENFNVEFKEGFRRRLALTVACVNIALLAAVIATLKRAQGTV